MAKEHNLCEREQVEWEVEQRRADDRRRLAERAEESDYIRDQERDQLRQEELQQEWGDQFWEAERRRIYEEEMRR